MTPRVGLHAFRLLTPSAYSTYEGCKHAFWRYLDTTMLPPSATPDSALIWTKNEQFDFTLSDEENSMLSQQGWRPYAFLSSSKRWKTY